MGSIPGHKSTVAQLCNFSKFVYTNIKKYKKTINNVNNEVIRKHGGSHGHVMYYNYF